MIEHVAQEILTGIIDGILAVTIDGILLAAVSCLLYLPFAWRRKRKFIAYLQGRGRRP